jgi:hypothetical protein
MKTKVGITFDELTHQDIYVYECSKCKARDFDNKECFWCKKRAEIEEYHREEASVGLI